VRADRRRSRVVGSHPEDRRGGTRGGTAGTQQTLYSVTRLVGPALGGLLVAVAGPAGAFTVDAATFAVLGVGALAVRTRRRPANAQTDPPDPMAARTRDTALSVAATATATAAVGGGRAAPRTRPASGNRLILANPVLGPVITILIAFVTMGTATNVAEVLVVTRVLGAGPAAFGAVGTAAGIGLVTGTLVARVFRTDPARVVAFCCSALLSGLTLIAEGLAPTLVVATVFFTANGFATGVASSCLGQVVVARTRDSERGRVFAAVGSASQPDRDRDRSRPRWPRGRGHRSTTGLRGGWDRDIPGHSHHCLRDPTPPGQRPR